MTAPATDVDLWLCPGPIQEFDLLLCPRGGTETTGTSYDRSTSVFIPLPTDYASRTQTVRQTALASVGLIDHLAFPAISSYTRFATDAQPVIATACAVETNFVRIGSEVVPAPGDFAERSSSYVREGLETPNLDEDPFRQVSYARLPVEQTSVEVEPIRAAAVSRDLFMGQGMGIEVARQADYVRESADEQSEDAEALSSVVLARSTSDDVVEQVEGAQRGYETSRTASATEQVVAEALRSLTALRTTSQSTALTDSTVRTTDVNRSVDAALVLLPLASRRVAFRRRPTEALAGPAEAASRVLSYARRPRFAEVAFRTSPAAARAVSYARLALIEQVVQDTLTYGSWNTSRTAYDALPGMVEAATQHLDLKRIARDLTLVGATASRVAHVTRRSNEYMAFVGSARRTVAYHRFTDDVVASQVDSAARRTAFPRRSSEDLARPELDLTRTTSTTRSLREVLESHAVARRTAAVSRLGAEQIPTEDTTSRSLTVIRLGAEEFGVIGDSAVRSALVTRSATEIISTDLALTRTLSYTRLLAEAVDLLVAPFTTTSYSRLVEDVVAFIEDVATRERVYRTPTQRFPQPFDLDLASERIYNLSLSKERTMVLDQSVAPAYDLTANHAEVLVVESDTGLWIVLTTDTEGEA